MFVNYTTGEVTRPKFTAEETAELTRQMAEWAKIVNEIRGPHQPLDNVVLRDGKLQGPVTRRHMLIADEEMLTKSTAETGMKIPIPVRDRFKFKVYDRVKVDGRKGEVIGLRWNPLPEEGTPHVSVSGETGAYAVTGYYRRDGIEYPAHTRRTLKGERDKDGRYTESLVAENVPALTIPYKVEEFAYKILFADDSSETVNESRVTK